MDTWKNIQTKNNDKLFLEIDNFFNHIEDINYLEYHNCKTNMAYNIIDAICDKYILLIESVVGIEKSYAYLIPLIQSIRDDEELKGFIISTSTVSLQEQLLKDVEKVMDILGIDFDSIEVILAKEKNNYICKKKLNEFIKITGNEKYQYIINEIVKSDSIDYFEEKINNSYTIAIDKRTIESLLYKVYSLVSDDGKIVTPPIILFDELNELFTELCTSSKNKIKKENEHINNFKDCGRLRFNVDFKVSSIIQKLIEDLNNSIKEVTEKCQYSNYQLDEKIISELEDLINVLQGMLLGDKSKNIYWIDFQDPCGNYLRLTYTKKKTDELSTGLFSKVKAGVIITNETLDIGKSVKEPVFDYNDYYQNNGFELLSFTNEIEDVKKIK